MLALDCAQGCRQLLVFDGGLDDRGARLAKTQHAGDLAQLLGVLQVARDALVNTHFVTHL